MNFNNFYFCIMENEKIIALYDNINFALKIISNSKTKYIKPFLINSELQFDEIRYDCNKNVFFNSNMNFTINHPLIKNSSQIFASKETINMNQLTNNQNNQNENQNTNKNNNQNIDQNNDIKNDNENEDLNLFIPLGIEEDYQYSFEKLNKEDSIDDNLDKNELLLKLKEKISNLRNLKEIEQENLSKLSSIVENKHEKLEKDNKIFTKKLNRQKRKKEKYESLNRKFEADKATYFRIKKDLEDNVLESIPPLFEKKYEILTEMNSNNELDNENSLNIYLSKIPHINDQVQIENHFLYSVFGEYFVKDYDIDTEEEEEEEDDAEEEEDDDAENDDDEDDEISIHTDDA